MLRRSLSLSLGTVSVDSEDAIQQADRKRQQGVAVLRYVQEFRWRRVPGACAFARAFPSGAT